MATIASLSRLSSAVSSAAAGDAVRHDDARMTNSRAPSGSAGGCNNGTYPNPGLILAPWAPVTLTFATTLTTDVSTGNHFRCTLTAAFTLANPTNPVDGQRITWELIQDATGSRTIAFGTKFAFGTDIPSVALTTTASKRDFLSTIYNLAADKFYVISFIRGY